MAEASPIRVILAEDHTIVRQGLRSLLQGYPNIEVVGEAADGEEAFLRAGKLQPAVVVMDINMPKLDGIAATRLIRKHYPHIAVLGLSVNAHGYHLDAMLKAGAFEVFTKETAANELYGAIQRAVAATQPILIMAERPAPADSAATSTSQSEIPDPSEKLPSKESK